MKVLAMYLPQYHEVEENNKWWGEGYTEWTAVKNAVAYSKKQNQPRVPLGNNYYDLSDQTAKAWKWQADIAKKYGIDGFVVYHYWFETGKQLLEKPMEILLEHKEIDINYAICWANETWTRTWYGVQSEILMKQEYGEEEEWKAHFDYLLPFFKDKRYIKVDGKPMINIYHSFEIDHLKQMLDYWNDLAVKNGFKGIYVVSGNTGSTLDVRSELFDAYYNFEPTYSLIHKTKKSERLVYGMNVYVRTLLNKFLKNKVIERPINGRKFINRIIRKDINSESLIFPGVFPQWDNSPRRKYKGTVFWGMTPELFSKQIMMVVKRYNNPKYLYINAWNEWGEGAYLEPDEINRYKYLEVINNVKNFINKLE